MRSGRCDEAYAETLRQFEVNASTIVTRSVYRKDIDQLMSAGLAARGWKPGKNGYFTHPVRGGATLLLLVTVSQDTEDPDVYIAGLSISSTCMRVPESLVDRF